MRHVRPLSQGWCGASGPGHAFTLAIFARFCTLAVHQFVTLLNHLLNFLAPALWLALLMPGLARLLWRGAPTRLKLGEQVGIQLVAGILVLIAGLVLLGRDGAMLTYAVLVGVAGVTQWVMQR